MGTKKIMTIFHTEVLIPNLLSQNLREGSLLDQQSLSLLHTLSATQQQNRTLPIFHCQSHFSNETKQRALICFFKLLLLEVFLQLLSLLPLKF
uniref:Uncharacterized protein n=1 Tax=Lotus japonicus TaxID=34305 RepID=I3T631_LOTJA|nr:unknown [Lotus japonicus]